MILRLARDVDQDIGRYRHVLSYDNSPCALQVTNSRLESVMPGTLNAIRRSTGTEENSAPGLTSRDIYNSIVQGGLVPVLWEPIISNTDYMNSLPYMNVRVPEERANAVRYLFEIGKIYLDAKLVSIEEARGRQGDVANITKAAAQDPVVEKLTMIPIQIPSKYVDRTEEREAPWINDFSLLCTQELLYYFLKGKSGAQRIGIIQNYSSAPSTSAEIRFNRQGS